MREDLKLDFDLEVEDIKFIEKYIGKDKAIMRIMPNLAIAHKKSVTAYCYNNFILNKTWTFGDRDFRIKKTIYQYGKFAMFSSLGALVQLGVVYFLVDSNQVSYPLALILAVITAAFGNFVLNKKWTFKEKLLG